MKFAQTQELFGRDLMIAQRPGREKFYASIKLDKRPRVYESLRTTNSEVARKRATAIFFNLTGAPNPTSFAFVWNLFEDYSKTKRLPAIRKHVESKWMKFLSSECDLDDAKAIEEKLNSYPDWRTGKNGSDGYTPNINREVKASAATLRLEYQSILQILRWARRVGIVNAVPTVGASVSLPTRKQVANGAPNRAIGKQQLNKIVKQLDVWTGEDSLKHHQRYSRLQVKYAALLSIVSGCPVLTIRTLRNYCLEFKANGTLEILVGITRDDGGNKVKHKVVASYMGNTKKACQWLQEWKSVQRNTGPGELLFSNPHGEDSRNQLSEGFSKFIIDRNLRAKNSSRITLGRLRHSYDNELKAHYSRIASRPKNCAEPQESIRLIYSEANGANTKNVFPPHIRFGNLSAQHGKKSWQRILKEESLASNLHEAKLTKKEVASLRTSDFTFHVVPKSDKKGCAEVASFVRKFEYLGTMPAWPTQRFLWRLNLKGKPRVISGAMVMSSPNRTSRLLGEETGKLERLISRGCTSAIAPKNMGSRMLKQACGWTVKNTPYRLFTGYSDFSCNEFGTIYQSASWMYLGAKHGTYWEYLTDRGWVGDRTFHERSSYMRIAKKVGIVMSPDWLMDSEGDRKKRIIDWTAMPEDVRSKLKLAVNEEKKRYERRKATPKGKYCLVLGSNKKETKRLRRKLMESNPDLPLEYPKRTEM